MANEHLAARGFWDHVPTPGGPGPTATRAASSSPRPRRCTPLGPRARPRRAADRHRRAARRAARPPAPRRHSPVDHRARGRTRPGARRPQGARPHLVDRRALRRPDPRRLRRHGREGGDADRRRRHPHGRSPLHPRNDEYPLEGGGLFANSNAGKLGLELDLRPGGREVLWDLLRWADVVVESFSAGAFERMGFGYEARGGQPGCHPPVELPARPDRLAGAARLRQPLLRPCSASTSRPAGRTGRPPGRSAPTPTWCRPASPWPPCSPPSTTGAAPAQGQHLDLSQAEASLHLLSPALLDAEVNGREFGPRQRRPRAWPPTASTRWRATTAGSPSPAPTTRLAAAWPRLARARADLAGLGRSRSAWPAATSSTRWSRRGPPAATPTSAAGGAAGHRRRRPPGAEQRRVPGRPAARPPRPLRDRRAPLLGPGAGRGAPLPALAARPAASPAPGPTYGQHARRCSATCSATTTTASPSSPPPAPSAERSPVSATSLSSALDE